MRAFVLLVLAISATAFTSAAEPPEARKRRPHWNVRVEVLMVALPQEKMLKLLPDLRDPAKVSAVVGELLAAVQRKEATLTGHSLLQTVDRQRSVSETIEEKRYPVDPEPAVKNAAPPAAPSQFVDGGRETPSFADTRNLGTTLEAEATVSRNGDSIKLDVVAQRVAFLGWENIENPSATGAAFAKGAQPQFFDSKVQTTVSLRNGGHLLLGVHVLVKPEGYMEVFVLQTAATAIK